MSSYYDDASLMLLASGGAQKDGKVYSIKPVPVYGSEEVTNGDFATDSDWTLTQATILNGKLLLSTSDGSYTAASQTLGVIGKTYKISLNVADIVGTVSVTIGGGTDFDITSNGIHSFEITSTSTTIEVKRKFGVTNVSATIDNISVKEVLVGDGDFTFSRGSNLAATRVGADGLIEKGRENLLLQSNNFDTTWVQNRVDLTSGQSGYDGGSDAWKLESNNSSTTYLDQSVVASGVQTLSVYAKAGTGDYLAFYNSSGARAWFNLSSGSLAFNADSIDTKIEAVGTDGWYRCSMTFNGSGIYSRIYVTDVNGNFTSAIGENILIQDAQLESGLAATDVIESGATRGTAGILEDTPRFDYSNGASCPSLLLEPSRTNRFAYSEYSGGFLSGTAISATDNQAISPEGLQNAIKIEKTTNGYTYFRTYIGAATGCLSVFAKKGNYRYIGLRNNQTDGTHSVFDFDTETFVNVASGQTCTFEDYGNGWYRLTAYQPNNEGSSLQGIALTDEYGSELATASIPNGSHFFIYGLQQEGNSSYATSYIPNHSGGTITRAQDVCGGAGDASTFNSTEGVLYAEIAALVDDSTQRFITLSDGTNQNEVRMAFENFGTSIISLRATVGGTQQAFEYKQFFSPFSILNYNKIAIVYAENRFELWVNGVKERSSSSGSTFPSSTLDRLDFNFLGTGINFYGNVKQVLTFNTALSDLDLAILTGATTYNTFAEMAVALNYTVYE